METVEYEEKWISGLNRCDVDVADEVFDRHCNFHITGSKEPLCLSEFKEKVKENLKELPYMKYKIHDTIIKDDKFVFRWVAKGVSPEGMFIQFEGLIIDRVAKDKDKVVERWEQWDYPGLMKQRGPMTTDKCCTIVPYFEVLNGKLDEFKGLCKELVAKASKEDECLYYGFSFDEHNKHNAHCREGYADAEGLWYHIKNVNDLLKKLQRIAVTYRLEIHGPEDELKKLKMLREELKPNPIFFALENGFRKR